MVILSALQATGLGFMLLVIGLLVLKIYISVRRIERMVSTHNLLHPEFEAFSYRMNRPDLNPPEKPKVK